MINYKMPALFIGHGSPMNAIENNRFTTEWIRQTRGIAIPKVVLCISAHWYTNTTTEITAGDRLATIYDFGGFPPALRAVDYAPPGDKELCRHIATMVAKTTEIKLNETYGIDHGSWSILKHIYPDAKIKVLQLSIDSRQSPEWHLNLARQLKPLRDDGVLILGSGNIVHNLRLLDWQNPDNRYEWAKIASTKIKQLILSRDFSSLANYAELGYEVAQAIPTPEHFLPLLYVLGVMEENEKITFFNDEIVMGSLSMTCLKIN